MLSPLQNLFVSVLHVVNSTPAVIFARRRSCVVRLLVAATSSFVSSASANFMFFRFFFHFIEFCEFFLTYSPFQHSAVHKFFRGTNNDASASFSHPFAGSGLCTCPGNHLTPAQTFSESKECSLYVIRRLSSPTTQT
jgi:hypothetical protein